jgi:hypothetical protein
MVLRMLRRRESAAMRARLSQAVAWCIGVPGTFWLLERVLAMRVQTW